MSKQTFDLAGRYYRTGPEPNLDEMAGQAQDAHHIPNLVSEILSRPMFPLIKMSS